VKIEARTGYLGITIVISAIRLRLQFAIKVEIVEPAVVQIVRRKVHQEHRQ
jgi:hypothetical protein